MSDTGDCLSLHVETQYSKITWILSIVAQSARTNQFTIRFPELQVPLRLSQTKSISWNFARYWFHGCSWVGYSVSSKVKLPPKWPRIGCSFSSGLIYPQNDQGSRASRVNLPPKITKNLKTFYFQRGWFTPQKNLGHSVSKRDNCPPP